MVRQDFCDSITSLTTLVTVAALSNATASASALVYRAHGLRRPQRNLGAVCILLSLAPTDKQRASDKVQGKNFLKPMIPNLWDTSKTVARTMNKNISISDK